jgi:hypothetical protein
VSRAWTLVESEEEEAQVLEDRGSNILGGKNPNYTFARALHSWFQLSSKIHTAFLLKQKIEKQTYYKNSKSLSIKTYNYSM